VLPGGHLDVSPMLTARSDTSGLRHRPTLASLLAWFLIRVVGTAFFGTTPGMVLFGLRVVRLNGQSMVGVWRAAIRAVLVALIVPAVIWDADHRGLQDKAADTMVLTTRSRA
jgi:uncharacterized RDD family membrane protein YckC